MTDLPFLTGKAKILWEQLSKREREIFLAQFQKLDAGEVSQQEVYKEIEAAISQLAQQKANKSPKNQTATTATLTAKVATSSICSFCGKGFLHAKGMVKGKSGAVICRACILKFNQSQES
ncbi:Hypothetical protein HDN1F_13390 [gamma proteobacterium HdN1]|nr:Hypothetical protein HDN1F_13390 [gamma proteobacterium HdN1]